jgi:hypothetical protein
MKKLKDLLKRIPVLSYILVGIFIVLMIIAVVIGIDTDRGVLVGFLAVIILLMEMTRRWRKEWHFLLLIVGALLLALILSFLHEVVVYPLVEKIGGETALQSKGLEVFHDIITAILTLVPVIAIIYGIIGAVTLFILRLVILCRKKISEKT